MGEHCGGMAMKFEKRRGRGRGERGEDEEEEEEGEKQRTTAKECEMGCFGRRMRPAVAVIQLNHSHLHPSQ